MPNAWLAEGLDVEELADESSHVTANAFALFLTPNSEKPGMSTRIELTDCRFALAGGGSGFQYHTMADSYAT